MKIEYKTIAEEWVEIPIRDALTPNRNELPFDVILSMMELFLEKELITFDEAISLIGDDPTRYRIKE
ncbi:MAG: hypothetical protein V4493_01125 [Pseudomonadota bacterium]